MTDLYTRCRTRLRDAPLYGAALGAALPPAGFFVYFATGYDLLSTWMVVPLASLLLKTGTPMEDLPSWHLFTGVLIHPLLGAVLGALLQTPCHVLRLFRREKGAS